MTESAALETYLTRPGILGYALRTDPAFREAFAAFLSGETRALLIAGEPGNGKSTLLDDMLLALGELADFPLAGVAYDAVHGMFIETLGVTLPRGETYPPARDLVSDVLRDTALHALEALPPDTRVLIEAPLIDRRGEAALDALAARGHRTQALLLHNPHVWRRVLAAGQRDSDLAAQVDAMLSIRRGLARRAGAASDDIDEQERAIAAYWARWAEAPGRLVLTWSGPESDAAATSTNERRLGAGAGGVAPNNGLFPDALAARARELCRQAIAGISDLPAFVEAVRSHGSAHATEG